MSYCRFSSNNFMCDVYVYKDCNGGWTTHVAGNRLAFPPIPEPPLLLVRVRGAKWDSGLRKMVYQRKIDALIAGITSRLFIWLSKPHKWTLSIIPRMGIYLPNAGESFNHETPGECADFLESLRSLGYNVPKYAIDALREEQDEVVNE